MAAPFLVVHQRRQNKRRQRLRWTIVLTGASRASGLTELNVSFLIDKEGKVVRRLSGAVDWDSREIRSLVSDLINEQD